MNVHKVDAKGPQDIKAMVHFSDHDAPGLFLAQNKIAQYPKNFREIARLLRNSSDPRAIGCAKWLQYEADEIENAGTSEAATGQ